MSTATTNFINLSYEDLESMNKEELVEVLNHFGVNAKSGWPKEALVDMASSRIAEAKAQERAKEKKAPKEKKEKDRRTNRARALSKVLNQDLTSSIAGRVVMETIEHPNMNNKELVAQITNSNYNLEASATKKVLAALYQMNKLDLETTMELENLINEIE